MQDEVNGKTKDGNWLNNYGIVVSKLDLHETGGKCNFGVVVGGGGGGGGGGVGASLSSGFTYTVDYFNTEIQAEDGITADRLRALSNRYVINLKENLDTCDIKDWDTYILRSRTKTAK